MCIYMQLETREQPCLDTIPAPFKTKQNKRPLTDLELASRQDWLERQH